MTSSHMDSDVLDWRPLPATKNKTSELLPTLDNLLVGITLLMTDDISIITERVGDNEIMAAFSKNLKGKRKYIHEFHQKRNLRAKCSGHRVGQGSLRFWKCSSPGEVISSAKGQITCFGAEAGEVCAFSITGDFPVKRRRGPPILYPHPTAETSILCPSPRAENQNNYEISTRYTSR